jgi:hypothetical protein
MTRAYRKASVRARDPQVVDKAQVLGGHVSIEVPVSVAEIIEGASYEAERLAGAAGLVAAEKRFRGVRGHKLMPKLLAALGCGGIAGGSTAA